MSTKQQRHAAILRIIASRTVSNQPQLRTLLEVEGFVATQATVSRDLEELGAVKIRLAGGASAYAIPEYEPARIAPESQLRRVLGEWVAEVTASGTVVVVRTPPGCAHVVASALDRSAMDGLLGTVAGDDTVICIATEDVGGRRLALALADLAGLGPRDAEGSGSKR